MIYSGYMCDRCGKANEYQRGTSEWLPNKTSLIRFARRDGWTVGKKVLCPRCRKKKAEQALKQMKGGKEWKE